MSSRFSTSQNFFMIGITNIESLTAESFLLNHSKSYWIAILCSWLEFSAESYFWPSIFSISLSLFGILLCLIGEVFRKLGMCHASTGFTHQVAMKRQRNHTLVTNGVYAVARHPGYLGWLIWSIGTQVILSNPVCFFAYAYISFDFFKNRIYEEEQYLIDFFGQRYVSYQRRVPTGIPGIRGFTKFLDAQ